MLYVAGLVDCPGRAQTGTILPVSFSVHSKIDIKSSSIEEIVCSEEFITLVIMDLSEKKSVYSSLQIIKYLLNQQ